MKEIRKSICFTEFPMSVWVNPMYTRIVVILQECVGILLGVDSDSVKKL